MTRFLNYAGSYSFALKNVNLKILENSLKCICIEVMFIKLLNAKLLRQVFQQRPLFLNIFSIDLILFRVKAL